MRRALLVLLASTLSLTAATPRAAGKRLVTENDLLKFTWIADPQISPDGSTVVFVRVTVNEKENRYESSLFAVPSSGSEPPRRLTSNVRDVSPRWAPDGRRIAFVRSPAASSTEKDSKPATSQLYLLAMDGGEARGVTDLPNGVTSPVWSPDGKSIAFLSPVDETKGREGRGQQDGREGNGASKSDVKVITRAVYRANGNPEYVDADRHTHIFVVSAPEGSDKATPEQLTDGSFDERDIAWARDGSRLYFTSTRVPEAYYEPFDSDLYSVSAAGGAIAKVASIDGTIANPSVSPDGKRIAFIGTLHGNPVRSYSQSDLFEEVSVDSRDPRRSAFRIRQRLHARIPVDGGQGLCRAVHEPARQHVVRAGLRQHHPVPLPRRRLQGPDGRR